MKEKIRTLFLAAGALIKKSYRSKVIYYHDVTPAGIAACTDMSTPMSLFMAHIDVIRRSGYEVVNKITKEKGQILISFDDGFSGIYNARNYFFDNKISPTIFLSNSLIGRNGYLTIDQIKELQREGFKFQCHTVSHDNLPQYNETDLWHEIWDSKIELEKILNEKVDEICFPQGLYSNRVIKACRKAGMKKMYTSIPGNYDINNPMVHRILCQNSTPFQFKLQIAGGMNILAFHYKQQHFKE